MTHDLNPTLTLFFPTRVRVRARVSCETGLIWSGLFGSSLSWSDLVLFEEKRSRPVPCRLSGLVWSGRFWSSLFWAGLFWAGLFSNLVWSDIE